MAGGILDLVETAYATELDGQEWLIRLNEKFAARFPNVVAWGGHVISKTAAGPPTFHNACLTEVDDAMEVFGPMHADMDPAFAEAIFPARTFCFLFSEHWGRVEASRAWDSKSLERVRLLHDYVRFRGADDILFCGGIDHAGRGVVLGAFVRETTLNERTRQMHERAAVHAAAGMRLRFALTSAATDPAEAIFETDGRVAHAEGHATEADARARLREAVKRIDRARTDAVRREEVEALDLWQGLTEGRWSLIDRHDTDGRRYYVAIANPPGGVHARQLTDVEAQVVAQVVVGEPNGIIAYSLGITESTVAGHLRNAMAKLGVSSRVELIRVGRALGA